MAIKYPEYFELFLSSEPYSMTSQNRCGRVPSYLARRPSPYLAGSGVNLCPSASVIAANILVAGEEQTLSRGSLARVGDSAQLPDAMSLLVCTTTVLSLAA